MTSPPWRRLRSELLRVAAARGRAETGQFSIEGTRLVERALRAGLEVRQALVRDDFGHEPREARLLEALGRAGATVVRAPTSELEPLTGGRDLGGILALAALPTAPRVEDLLRCPGPLLVGCRTFDPGNVGALVRTAHALGACGWCGVEAGDPFHPRSVQTSRGSVFRLPLASAPDLAVVASAARAAGRPLVGAVADGEATDTAALAGDAVLVLGSEAHGLDASELDLLDARVRLETAPDVDSLSINAAAAILLWEIRAARAERRPRERTS